MKKVLLLFVYMCFLYTAFAQNDTQKKKSSIISSVSSKITGQWRGYFDDNGINIGSYSDNNTEFVLELDINGARVTGFSYSYFQNRQYYVICSLSGVYDNSTKSIKVTETARIKGLTPPDWVDCLQTHYLSYQKEGATEKLVGRWKTAPGQTSGCGTGTTVLTRKTLSKNFTATGKSNNSNNPFSAPKNNNPAKKVVKEKNNLPLAKNNQKQKISPEKIVPPVPNNSPVEKENIKENPETEIKKSVEKSAIEIDMAKRNSNVLKTIEIESETFRVDLYDNGEIDGDSISLFYNGKLLLSHKRLSDKAITLSLNASDMKDINELTMYAENLGTIPPNTALMVITDGDKRYEARISSDLQKSGTIRFVHKQKKE